MGRLAGLARASRGRAQASMIRSIALAAGLGALVAAGTLYAASQSPWRSSIAGMARHAPNG